MIIRTTLKQRTSTCQYTMKYRKLYIKNAIPSIGFRVDINVDPPDVCVPGKVVITVFRFDVEKILDDVSMTFGDVLISLGEVVVIISDVDEISGVDGVIFLDVSEFCDSVVLNICSVVKSVSPVVKLCSVDNLAGVVNVCVVELSSIFDVIRVVKEKRYSEIAVVLSDVVVVPGKVVWVT